jgi:hypothetical protein
MNCAEVAVCTHEVRFFHDTALKCSHTKSKHGDNSDGMGLNQLVKLVPQYYFKAVMFIFCTLRSTTMHAQYSIVQSHTTCGASRPLTKTFSSCTKKP